MTSISKDVERGAYTASDWRDPAGLGPGPHTLTIAPGDLDPQGCFYFQDGAGQPLIFVASKLKLGLGSGLLNFDLIGTFFDFDVSSTGKWANGKADNWYSSEIQNFWVKGKVVLKSESNLKLLTRGWVRELGEHAQPGHGALRVLGAVLLQRCLLRGQEAHRGHLPLQVLRQGHGDRRGRGKH